MAEGFFGRWSQRKLSERQGKQPEQPVPDARPEPAQPPASAARPAGSAVPATTPAAVGGGGNDRRGPPADAPAPTMQDVASLHKDSDFKPFVSRAVQPEVRNAAMKKMFGDPHFNVMDGLDTYIDDYSVPDPLPAAMLRKMASAQFLRLFDDEGEKERAGAPAADATAAGDTREDADGAAPAVVAQSTFHSGIEPPTGPTGTHDDDTDLRLQPDDATGPARPGRGAE
jgi:hypothetical protein